MLIAAKATPAFSAPRRRRNNHAVDGTITSAPSQVVWRTVPPARLTTAALTSQITIALSLAEKTARWHMEMHTTMKNRPGTSVMKDVVSPIKRGDNPSVKAPRAAFRLDTPNPTSSCCIRKTEPILMHSMATFKIRNEKPKILMKRAPHSASQPTDAVAQPL